MKKIERPDWNNLIYHCRDGLNIDLITVLDKCWDEYVEPMNKLIENAVEVSGESRSSTDGLWNMHETILGKALPNHTHKAYLIGIEPIKKESKYDFIKWVIAVTELYKETPLGELVNKRAKAVLEENDQ